MQNFRLDFSDFRTACVLYSLFTAKVMTLVLDYHRVSDLIDGFMLLQLVTKVIMLCE